MGIMSETMRSQDLLLTEHEVEQNALFSLSDTANETDEVIENGPDAESDKDDPCLKRKTMPIINTCATSV